MLLWSQEMEEERAEARAAVASGFAAFKELLGGDQAEPGGGDVASIVRRQREQMARHAFTVPEAQDREIAGVRCRVFLPEGRARAVYLHFHGGGMITGAPEMNDIPNRELARQHGVAVVSVDYRLTTGWRWRPGCSSTPSASSAAAGS
jgi:acetyl esterase/lipase